MPTPGATGEWFLDTHFGMVMINFIAEQLLHGIDNAWGARDGAVDIFSHFVPKDELGSAAFTVLEIVSVLLESGIGFGGFTKNVRFFRVEQGTDENVAIAMEGRYLGI